MARHKVKKLIYSSTCATYGEPDKMPITEDTPQVSNLNFALDQSVMKLFLCTFLMQSIVFRSRLIHMEKLKRWQKI